MKSAAAGFALTLTLVATTVGAEERTLTIGAEGYYPPFQSIDNTGELVGLDIDIGNAICAELQAECDWVTGDFEGLIPALQNGLYDMVIASHSITEERLAVVDMVRYYGNSASIVFLADNVQDDLSPEGLAGLTIGVHAGTTHAAFVEQSYPDVAARIYPTQVAAFEDLLAGRVDGVMGDTAALFAWVNDAEGAECCALSETTLHDPILGDGVGIIVDKSNSELRDEIAAAIATLRETGVYDEITGAYFPFPLW